MAAFFGLDIVSQTDMAGSIIVAYELLPIALR